MITLITYPAQFGTRSSSPFCIKAEYLLNMAGVPWQRQDENDPRKWPKAKLPAITVDTDIIGDSDGIRLYLEGQGADFDKNLTDIEKAQSHTFIRMAEEHMYFHLVMDRWGNDAVWPTIRDVYFGDIPKLPRLIIARGLRAKLMKGMLAQGLGRLSPAERMERLEPDLQAIRSQLSQGNFLFGSEPCVADTSVASVLAAMRATPIKTDLSQRIASDQLLSDYIDRVDAALG
ncbi:MAG: glutathione S-transferase [Candidatus Azotimanducaceae bacterium]|jgi:glutathione S-transferase